MKRDTLFTHRLKGKKNIGFRASPTENVIQFYFTIPKDYFTNYTIPFYNTPNIPKFYFFPILFKYFILFFFHYFSFSIHFPLFLPQPLASVSTHRATHTQRPMIHRSTYPNPSPHTQSHIHTQTQVITLLKQTFSFLKNHDKRD